MTEAPLGNPWPHGDPRAVVDSILADPRYHQPPAPAAQPSWFDLLVGWLAGVVRRFLPGLDRALGAHNPFETGIGFVVIAAAFALLGFAIYLLVRSYLFGFRGRAGRTTGPETRLVTTLRTSVQLRAAAAEAARRKHYRDAAALLFGAAVRALDERGRIAYDAARTPGEYRRLIRDSIFDDFTNDAVVAVFAAAEPPPELIERMSGAYDEFFAAAAGAAPACMDAPVR